MNSKSFTFPSVLRLAPLLAACVWASSVQAGGLLAGAGVGAGVDVHAGLGVSEQVGSATRGVLHAPRMAVDAATRSAPHLEARGEAQMAATAPNAVHAQHKAQAAMHAGGEQATQIARRSQVAARSSTTVEARGRAQASQQAAAQEPGGRQDGGLSGGVGASARVQGRSGPAALSVEGTAALGADAALR